MKKTLTILTIFICSSVEAQDLYIPSGAEFTISDGAEVAVGTDLLNNGRLEVKEGGSFICLGNITNVGFFINNGQLDMYQNWANAGTFNTSQGEMVFSGEGEQQFASSYLPISSLVIHKSGTVKFNADSIKITERLHFIDGVLTSDNSTRFIVESGAEITHELGSDSYYEGVITSRGTGYRIFPVGNNGYFGTLAFLEMQGSGSSTEIDVSLIHDPIAATPGPGLIGVSDHNRWKIQLNKGEISESVIQIDFTEEDIESFTNPNNIRHKFSTPVIAVADSIQGAYSSLGIESLYDTDSVSFGIITSGESASFVRGASRYFGIALAPTIDPKGEIFFPNVFAPAASDERNQTYKVFGELIANSPFQIKIYNRFSTLVYQADTFEEANQIGWNGVNEAGKEEETGLFYVFVQYAYAYEPGKINEYSGTIMLKR